MMDRFSRLSILRGARYLLHCALVLAAALSFIAAVPVSAHPPSSVFPVYDSTTGELRVTIAHAVPNPGDHYIGKVEVGVNGHLVNASTYSGQPSPDAFTYTYPVAAQTGDEITVSVTCNLAGSGSGRLTVGSSGTTTEPAATQAAGPSIPVIPIAACFMLFMVQLRRNIVRDC